MVCLSSQDVCVHLTIDHTETFNLFAKSHHMFLHLHNFMDAIRIITSIFLHDGRVTF